MTRQSIVKTEHDKAGDYEVETIDCPDPKRVIVCSHGRGVRRWDGKKFFYAVAEHYADSAVLLTDLNQHDGALVRMNPLPIETGRVAGLIETAKRLHPGVPIVLLAHSMGCGVAALMDLRDVSTVVLVTPAVGAPYQGYIERYGADIVNGKIITSSEGTQQEFPAEFMASTKGIVWEDEYRKLVARFQPVYAFEAADDEIVGDGRFAHRNIPFTKYVIIPGAKHNLSGQPLTDFLANLDNSLTTSSN
jgi:pimeloyl-ACP methyl ester carboxylesterase